jgi:hypothetical protein
MLKEHSVNAILESKQCCNKLRCAEDVKKGCFMVFKMTCAFAASMAVWRHFNSVLVGLA